MQLFEKLGIDMGYVLLGAIGVSVLLFILIIILFVKNSRLNKKYKEFMADVDGKSLESAFKEKFDNLENLRETTNSMKKKLSQMDEALLSTYQKIGIVKYDAFKEMGGKLSFALALLTETDDGFILNCMHSSREGCYTYIKEIIKGESFVILAEEEKEALEAAKSCGDYTK